MTNPKLIQASSLFAFLKDILRLRHKPQKTIEGYVNTPGGWVHHLDETPDTKNGIEFWSSLGIKAFNSLQGDVVSAVQLGVTTFKEMKGAILRFPRVTISDPPAPSDQLGPWLDNDFEDAINRPGLLEFIEEVSEDGESFESDEDFSIDDFPDVQREYENWIQDWDKWAAKVKQDQEIAHIYNSLFEARNTIKDHAEDWEFVLGLGRLRLGVGTDKLIDRHLYTIPCTIDLDPATGTLFVRIDDSATYTEEDDWILGFDKPSKEHLDEVKEILDVTTNLDDPLIKKSLIQLAHKYHPNLISDSTDVNLKKRESLLLAPSLILRKRSKQDLINLLETLEQSLGESENLPAPLMSLLEPGYGDKSSSGNWSGDGAVVRLDDSIYLPLALNQKQIQALEKADTRNATLIQGPPGTGKTRTIAVMVSHFLAKGQRVLVVAETSQALREVRSQLPDEIRDLAVASLGGGKTDNDDLQKAVNALVEAHENRSELTHGFDQFEKDSRRKIEALHSERSGIFRKIIDLRSKEAYKIQLEGYEDSPAQLAQIYIAQREKFSWLNKISDSLVVPPLFSATQASELIEKLVLVWRSPVEIRSSISLPLASELWPLTSFENSLKLRELKSQTRSDFTLTSVNVDAFLAVLEPTLDSKTLLRNNGSKWTERVIASACSFSDTGTAENVKYLLNALNELDTVLTTVGEIGEIASPITSTDWLPLITGMIEKVNRKGDLRTSATGEIRKTIIPNALNKNAIPKLNLVKISGKSPSTVAELKRIEGLVHFDQLLRKISGSLQVDESSLPSTRQEQVAWLRIQKRSLEAASTFFEQIQLVKQFLQQKLPRTSEYLQKDLNLDDLFEATQAISATDKLLKHETDLLSHKTKIQMNLKNENLEFVDEYLSALETDDLKRFEMARQIMEKYTERLDLSKSAEEYARAIFGADALLMKNIIEWINSDGEDFSETPVVNQINELVEAMRWRRLGHELGSQVHEDYAKLFRELISFDESIEVLMRGLSKRRSWKKALDRISAATVSDMERYAFETRKLGKGTGTTAPQRKREIRKYLENCIPAIPAWITPIANVAKLFPAQLELFDVVIVDEASQARLDAIFLLALCKRVVIVGDHKQVSPDKAYMKDADIQTLVKRHLSGDARAANWANPDISLFDECKMAFGGMVTLTEHRRCVPEIIGFSNQIAYIPENIRLIPVRQTGSESLQPIKTVFVPNGYVRGNQGSIVNPPEADALIAEVANMLKDSRYRGKTIGIITLQGDKQKELLTDRLHAEVNLIEIEKRQIRVGKPADFQGSERDIILLSMVMAPERRFQAQTQEMMVQRYNVAMSRAKDQVVLVHSLRASDIVNQKDLRRQLIDYCYRVESGALEVITGTVGLVSDSERDSRFDSLFEQRVHNLIVGRGYKVIPQYEPQIDGHDYRIDLVVVGTAGKFAIECDGDFWHGPDEYERDLIRQQTLEKCGWRFFRIPESKFYSDLGYLDALWPLLDEITKSPVVVDLPMPPSREFEDSQVLEISSASSGFLVEEELDSNYDLSEWDVGTGLIDADEQIILEDIEIATIIEKIEGKTQEQRKMVDRFPTKAELESRKVTHQTEEVVNPKRKKEYKFPSKSELEARKIAEQAANASQSASIDLIRGDGIGDIWTGSKGRQKLLLVHEVPDLLTKRGGISLDAAFSGRAKQVAEFWLTIRPTGGRVFIDEAGNAITYQGNDLIFLGNISHIFNLKIFKDLSKE